MDLNTFYCIGCRAPVIAARLGQLVEAAHHDGTPVGFCRACLLYVMPEPVVEVEDEGVEPDAELSA